MKTVTLLACTVAMASAQLSQSPNGTFYCARPNVAYCAGDSLGTDIIYLCDRDAIGHPGRCSDRLDGEPPVGDSPSLCWQSFRDSGDAACEKNCVVYGGSGNHEGDFTLPGSLCVPTYTPTPPPSSASSASSAPPPPSSVSTTSSPPSSSQSVPLSTGSVGGNSNSTSTTTTSSTTAGATPPTSQTSGSRTPTAPTTLPTTVPTSGASLSKAGGLLAAIGVALAYLL